MKKYLNLVRFKENVKNIKAFGFSAPTRRIKKIYWLGLLLDRDGYILKLRDTDGRILSDGFLIPEIPEDCKYTRADVENALIRYFVD